MTDSNTDIGSQGQPVSRSKVGRVIESYGLENLGEELEVRWTGRNGERMSLRDLADEFNRRILKAAISESGEKTLPSEIESWYEALTDEDNVSRGVAIQVRRRLERRGVDVESLLSDFVTHQAVYNYLTKYRGVELTQQTDEEFLSKKIETIQRLRGRVQAVTQNTLNQLRKADHLKTGNLDVVVSIRATCSGCRRQYDVLNLLSEGRCECHTESE